jgi:hypothetical protein
VSAEGSQPDTHPPDVFPLRWTHRTDTRGEWHEAAGLTAMAWGDDG